MRIQHRNLTTRTFTEIVLAYLSALRDEYYTTLRYLRAYLSNDARFDAMSDVNTLYVFDMIEALLLNLFETGVYIRIMLRASLVNTRNLARPNRSVELTAAWHAWFSTPRTLSPHAPPIAATPRGKRMSWRELYPWIVVLRSALHALGDSGAIVKFHKDGPTLNGMIADFFNEQLHIFPKLKPETIHRASRNTVSTSVSAEHAEVIHSAIVRFTEMHWDLFPWTWVLREGAEARAAPWETARAEPLAAFTRALSEHTTEGNIARLDVEAQNIVYQVARSLRRARARAPDAPPPTLPSIFSEVQRYLRVTFSDPLYLCTERHTFRLRDLHPSALIAFVAYVLAVLRVEEHVGTGAPATSAQLAALLHG